MLNENHIVSTTPQDGANILQSYYDIQKLQQQFKELHYARKQKVNALHIERVTQHDQRKKAKNYDTHMKSVQVKKLSHILY